MHLIFIFPDGYYICVSLIKGQLNIHSALVAVFRLDNLDQSGKIPICIRPSDQVDDLIFKEFLF